MWSSIEKQPNTHKYMILIHQFVSTILQFNIYEVLREKKQNHTWHEVSSGREKKPLILFHI